MIPGITITGTDKVCNVNELCEIFVNVTNKGSNAVYIYNSKNVSMKFTPEVDDYKVYYLYRNKWYFTNFTKETKIGLSSSSAYVFSFPAYTTRQFKIVVDLKNVENIKYDFSAGSETLDPTITVWDYIYPNKTITEKEALMNWTTCYKWTYKNVTIEVPCDAKNVTEHCFKCKVQNATSVDCKNYTYEAPDKQVSYDCWQEVIIEVEKIVPDTSKPKEGIQVGDKVIMKQWINVINNTYLVEYAVNWGDRNLIEFGDCREYERTKLMNGKPICTTQRLDSPNLSVSK
jgi:hypothetical protein